MSLEWISWIYFFIFKDVFNSYSNPEEFNLISLFFFIVKKPFSCIDSVIDIYYIDRLKYW